MPGRSLQTPVHKNRRRLLRLGVLAACILLFLLFNAGGFALERQIIGRYYITAVDSPEDRNIGFQDADGHGYSVIIPETVVAVGFNNNYITARQHPSDMYSSTMDTIADNFYIIALGDPSVKWGNESLIGPLSEAQFNQKRYELKMGKIDFTIVYPKR